MNHAWYFYQESLWGEKLTGPIGHGEFLELVKALKVDETTKVCSPTITKGVWTTVSSMPHLVELVVEARKQARICEEAERLQRKEQDKADREARRQEKLKAKEQAKVRAAEAQQRATAARDNGFRELANRLIDKYEQLEVILGENTDRSEKGHALRILEQDVVQIKRDVNSKMQLIRSKASYEEANSGVMADTLFTLFGKPGAGRSYRASSRRSVRSEKESKLRRWQALKCNIEEVLVAIDKMQHTIRSLDDSHFREEVPDCFEELIATDEETEVRDILVKELESLAFDIYCCMMASDRKITKAEREAVVSEMVRFGCELEEQEIASNVGQFVERVQQHGLTKIKENILVRVKALSERGCPLRIVLEGVVRVAKADGVVTPEEREFCKDIDSALSSPLQARFTDHQTK